MNNIYKNSCTTAAMCASLSTNVNNHLSLFIACVYIKSVVSTETIPRANTRTVMWGVKIDNASDKASSLRKRAPNPCLHYQTHRYNGEICRTFCSSIQTNSKPFQSTTNTLTWRFTWTFALVYNSFNFFDSWSVIASA